MNDVTKRIERFPQIGAFEVWFDKFMVYSKLRSDYVVISDEGIVKTHHEQQAVGMETAFS